MTETSTNIIVFGDSFVGKSSVINMVAGREVTKISSGAKACTFRSEGYDVDILGSKFRFFDTAGLNALTTEKMEALYKLIMLICNLQSGVSLLVYVIRPGVVPKPAISTLKNYRLFYELLCEEKVPLVLVVTGLESEHPMDGWWEQNKDSFTEHKMSFRGHACITATRGRTRGGELSFEQEYEESRQKVQRLILDNYLREPFKTVTHVEWSLPVTKKFWNMIADPVNFGLLAYDPKLADKLQEVGLPRKEAVSLANVLTSELAKKK